MTPNMTKKTIAIWKYERLKKIKILLPKVTLIPKVFTVLF